MAGGFARARRVSCAAMPAARRRPRQSRVLLVVLIVALGWLAWTTTRWLEAPATPAPVGEGARIAFRPLPYVNYGLTPDYTRDPGERGLVRTTNALGFRGAEVAQPKPEGRWRIACLGGSTTYSDLVDDDDAYPALLERILRERQPGRDLDVVNAGVPSYTSADSLANLANRVIDLAPDVVVLYQAVNDYRTRKYANYDDAYFHYRRVWDGSLGDAVQGDAAELQGGINPYVQHAPPSSDLPARQLVQRSGTGAYRRNLTSLVGLARAHGAEPVFVTFLVHRTSPFVDELMLRSIDEYNRVMAEVAEQHGVTLIDLATQVDPEGLFGDPVHMNAKGTLQKARVVAQGLLDAGL